MEPKDHQCLGEKLPTNSTPIYICKYLEICGKPVPRPGRLRKLKGVLSMHVGLLICSKRGSRCQRTAAGCQLCLPGPARGPAAQPRGQIPTCIPQLHHLLLQVSPWQAQLMLTWTQNVQETFNLVFRAFDVISVLSFIKNLITLFTFDLHFISAFHLLCLSLGETRVGTM